MGPIRRETVEIQVADVAGSRSGVCRVYNGSGHDLSASDWSRSCGLCSETFAVCFVTMRGHAGLTGDGIRDQQDARLTEWQGDDAGGYVR